MPTKILSRGKIGNPPAEVRFEVDYDGNFDATVFRCVNETQVNAWCRLSLANGRGAERTFAPGTTEIEIPTSVAARLRFVLNPARGNRLENLNTEIMVPAGPQHPAPIATGRHG